MSNSFPYIGTVSHGTMRSEDLMPTFCDVLRDLDRESTYQDLQDECAALMDSMTDDGYFADSDQERASELVNDLFDALSEFAPPYFYFGATDGDGCDYGFWFSEDAMDEAVYCEDAIKVSDTADIPEGYTGEVFMVTDHGNVSLYTVQPWGENLGAINKFCLTEIWAIV